MKTTLAYKIALIFLLSVIIIFATACNQTLIDIYTELNTDYSGTRVVDLAVKTEYLQKGDVVLSGEQSLYQKLTATLPQGKIDTYEQQDYTHFRSTATFKDINFLQHISIDNFSQEPAPRFYAKMSTDDYFFYSDYFFYDYVDMEVDQSLIEASDQNSDYRRLEDLVKADSDLLSITYQIKFPVKIIESNADIIGDNNIAIWNLKYGQKRDIWIEGKKTKFLSYFLIIALGLIGLFIIFIIFALIFSSRRGRRQKDSRKPLYSYDNYFKKEKHLDDY
ncbi:MAG: hypothetical protein U5N58_03395 [Actinomycetota bacterium]|nr:hypothetical protein [Actinomycetota bacterium]